MFPKILLMFLILLLTNTYLILKLNPLKSWYLQIIIIYFAICFDHRYKWSKAVFYFLQDFLQIVLVHRNYFISFFNFINIVACLRRPLRGSLSFWWNTQRSSGPCSLWTWTGCSQNSLRTHGTLSRCSRYWMTIWEQTVRYLSCVFDFIMVFVK